LIPSSLRRRFEQNQTDCTFTVLALLPNVTENILEALRVEQLTNELQQKKAERLARSAGEGPSSELSSGPSSVRDGGDTASLSSFQSSSYIHASQLAEPDSGVARPRKSKAQLWNEIKISSITRSFTLLYTLSLLTLLTRIQLNLLGRLNYLSSVISLTRPSPPERANSISLEDNDNSPGSPGGPTFGNDFETNRRYLAFTWFLLNKGYADLLSEIQAAVTEVLGNISPTEAITASRLSDLTLQVRQKIEGSTANERRSKNWLAYLLPPREEEEHLLIESGVLTPPSTSSNSLPDQKPPFPTPNPKPSPHSLSGKPGLQNPSNPIRKLLDETSDLIESPTFTRIHALLLNSLFSHLIDHKVVEQAFPPTSPQNQRPQTQPQPPNSPSNLPEILSTVTIVPINQTRNPTTTEPTAKLATILAVLTRQAHAIGNGNNPPNEYIEVMEREVRQLEAFAAVIYSSQLQAGSVEEGNGVNVEEGAGKGDTGAGLRAELAAGLAVAAGGAGEKGEGASGSGSGSAHSGLEALLESAWSTVLGSPPPPSSAPPPEGSGEEMR
jgi:peroxin-3